jgi:hypothetical protein
MKISPQQLEDSVYIDRESVATALNTLAEQAAKSAFQAQEHASAILALTRSLEIIDRQED